MSFKYVLFLCITELFWKSALGDYYTPSAKVGKLLAKYNRKHDSRHPFELGLGYYYQGDMMFPPPAKGRVSISEQYVAQIWPNGRVPYQILGSFSSSQRKQINNAIEMFKMHTCVRFVRKTAADPLWIKIVNNNTGCYSYVGRQTNNQYNLINLQTPACTNTVGTPIHEMMHALGFYHEHTRPDRDDWITIDRSALREEYQSDRFYNANFGKLDEDEVDTYNIPYSYGSVMHYSKYAGSRSTQSPVMINMQPWSGDFGNEEGFSQSDIDQINIRYQCNDRKKGKKPNRKVNDLSKVARAQLSTRE